jgi:hypothetical protein
MEVEVRKTAVTTKAAADQVVKDILRATRKLHSSGEKIWIVLPASSSSPSFQISIVLQSS